MFLKHSRADILAYRSATEKGFTRNASQDKTASFFQNNGTKVDVKTALENVADTYKISSNPGDYIFVISRALTADTPNENHDCFPAEELLRFDPKLGCRVFQTFNLKPNHINHRADDPTQARGVILDAHYNDLNKEEVFVEILVAVDKTKDKKLAEGILKGDINSMSMGCFQAGTPILMADGSFKSIEHVIVGDEVITHLGNSKKVTYVMSRDHGPEIN
mgnify:FL=1